MNKIPIIIDTDPGMDDAVAIVMLAGSGKVDIKALTSTHGNIGLKGTTENCLKLKELLDLDCIVAKGANKPMIVPQKDASFVHGANGLAGYELPEPKCTVYEKAAWDVVYEIAKQYSGELCIVSIGPLTNTAIAILKYPDIKKHIKRIYMMGGSRDFGNHSQHAEFNVWGDPHAAAVVLDSGIPITMADLRFGYDNAINARQGYEVYTASPRLRPMFETFWQHDQEWMHHTAERMGIDFDIEKIPFNICDATAAATLLLENDGVETQDYYVKVETQSTLNSGMTVFDYKDFYKAPANVQLAVKMDVEKYYNQLLDSMKFFK